MFIKTFIFYFKCIENIFILQRILLDGNKCVYILKRKKLKKKTKVFILYLCILK